MMDKRCGARIGSWALIVGFCWMAASCRGADEQPTDTKKNMSPREATKAIAESFRAAGESTGEAWQSTKAWSTNAWSSTKEKSQHAWKSTKDGSKQAWDSAKDGSKKAWQATKDAFDGARVGMIELMGGKDAKKTGEAEK